MIKVRFAHNYPKLHFPVFPTVRGISWLKKVKLGDKLLLVAPREQNLCTIVMMEKKKLGELSLYFMQLDGNFSQQNQFFCVSKPQDYLDLLNSFRYPNRQLKMDDEVLVLWLVKYLKLVHDINQGRRSK